MELQHLVAKIHVEGPLTIDPAQVVDVMHQWVAQQSMPGVALVDVAELLHVPKGPGVIAVGYEADYALDHTDGIWGVLHRQKTQLPGTDNERVAHGLREAAQAAARLQEAFPALKLSRTSFELIINDRGIAPNTDATYAIVEPALRAALEHLLGHGEFTFTRHNREPRQRCGVTVTTARPFVLTPAAVA